jgi:uncharacterized membrane protein
MPVVPAADAHVESMRACFTHHIHRTVPGEIDVIFGAVRCSVYSLSPAKSTAMWPPQVLRGTIYAVAYSRQGSYYDTTVVQGVLLLTIAPLVQGTGVCAAG